MVNLLSQSILPPWRIIREASSIYRTNFPVFFRMALYSAAWFLAANVPWLFLVGVLFSLYLFLASPTVFSALFSHLPSGLLGHALIAAVILLIISLCLSPFTSAKGLLRQAAIAQLAYQILSGSPEPLKANLRLLQPRLWQFWLVEFYINGVLTAVGHLTSSLGERLLGEWVIWGLSIAIQIWLMAQWFLTNLVIAVEQRNAQSSLRLSREWAKPHMLTICCLLIGTGGLTLPLYLLAFSPTIAVWLAEQSTLAIAQLTPASLLHLLLALALSLILATLCHILTIPLWQSTKAVLYHHLKLAQPTSA